MSDKVRVDHFRLSSWGDCRGTSVCGRLADRFRTPASIRPRFRIRGIPFGAFALTLLTSLTSVRAEEPAAPLSGEKRTQDERTDVSPPNAETVRLGDWVGSWSFVERHYDPAGAVVATVRGQEDVIWILDKHAIRRSYTAVESSFRASGTLAWNVPKKQYEGMWFDNASANGPTHCRAEWNADSKTMAYTLESVSPDGKPVIHRSVEQWAGDERRVATTYLVQGDALVKRLEVEYKRTTPCPAKQSGMRMIKDGLDAHGVK